MKIFTSIDWLFDVKFCSCSVMSENDQTEYIIITLEDGDRKSMYGLHQVLFSVGKNTLNNHHWYVYKTIVIETVRLL